MHDFVNHRLFVNDNEGWPWSKRKVCKKTIQTRLRIQVRPNDEAMLRWNRWVISEL